MLKRTSLQKGSQLTALDSRKFPRKRVLFSGVITGPEAESPIDCTIRDISASGAQVQIERPLMLRSRLYLIDTRNEAAHLAAVAWVRGHRLGLSFVHSHLLDLGLATELNFLKTVLVEAKLRQVRSLVKRGQSVEEATSLVGLNENYLDRLGICRNPTRKHVYCSIKHGAPDPRPIASSDCPDAVLGLDT